MPIEGDSMLTPKQAWPLLKQAASDFLEDKAPKLAAALAYYTAFAFAPMLVLGVMALGTVTGDQGEAGQRIENQLTRIMGPTGGEAAKQMLQQADSQPKGMALVVSVALLLFAASGVFGELQDSMNTIWEVKPRPGLGIMAWIRSRFFSMAMVLGVGFLLIVSLVASTVLTAVSTRIFGDWKVVGFIVNTIVSLAVTTVLFAGIFKLLPDVKLKWRDVIPGAVLTAVLFEIGKWGLTLYLTKASPTSSFGAAGSLAALLIWVYYSGWIMFFGAEFTQAYVAVYGAKAVPSEIAEPVTAEMRAQQGLSTQKDSRAETRGEFRGGARPPYRQPAPSRKVVTIEQPSQMNRQGYLLAAGGLAAGAILGAAGVFTGRKWGEPQLTAMQINERINALENRCAHAKSLERYGKELALMERVAQIEQRVTDAATSLKRTVNPPWYVKLTQPRKAKPPTGWYARVKQYVS
jgi:membrane protein